MMSGSSSDECFSFPQRRTLFEQVSERIGALISNGRWRPGEMLPNEVELASLFGVSQGTMRRALRMLVDTGVLVRQQGRGTFVAEFSRNEGSIYRRFIRLLPDREEDEASPSRSMMLYFERELPPEEVRVALELPLGVKTIHAARALNTSRGLVTHDELWANQEVFDKLTKENLGKHEETMLYAFYQRVCGVTITRCEETVKAKQRPIVIITSNAEKELPDAFLRRCVFHYIEFPEQEQMEAILRVHFGDLEEKLVKQSLAAFYWLRELRGIEKKPSTSELVDWIRALVAGGVDPARIEKEIPFAGVLLKKDKDLQTLRKVK